MTCKIFLRKYGIMSVLQWNNNKGCTYADIIHSNIGNKTSMCLYVKSLKYFPVILFKR